MSQKLRLGIIGAGGIAAKLHLPDLVRNTDYEVTLISGRKESRLKLLIEKFHIPRYTTHAEDVVGDANIDAVLIATPHPQHVAWGLKALAANKHVFMQKPLSATMDEADAFVAAVEKTSRTVYCLPHFSPVLYKLRELIATGAIGRVSGARSRTSHGGPEVYYAGIRGIFGEKDDGDLWFFDAQRAGVGALFDMGVYAVSNLVAVLGSITRVMSFVGTFDKPTALEDNAVLLLQFENGALGVAETSWCDPARTNEMSIHGTMGKFTIPGKDGAPATQWTPASLTSEDLSPLSEPVDCGAGAGGMHEHFLDCIRRGIQPPISNAHTARHVTEVLLAGLEAGRTMRPVDVKSRAARG